MSYREVYRCDICREEKDRELMMGCRFSDMHRFTLDTPGTTKGTHICTLCLDQLEEQLSPKRSRVPQEAKHGG